MRLLLKNLEATEIVHHGDFVVAVADVKLENFDPMVAQEYVDISQRLDQRIPVRYGCLTPHNSDPYPEANLLHHVEHSIGRIAVHQAETTTLQEAITNWSTVYPDKAVMMVISRGTDTSEVAEAMTKGIDLANKTFGRIEKILDEQWGR